MALGILIMVALLLWFFLVKVTIYEFSTELDFTETGLVTASFPKENLKKLAAGQPAIIQIDLGPNQPGVTLTGMVIGTDPNQETAELVILSEEITQIPVDEDISGQVQVEVEYVTPAMLVRRASGMYVNNSQYPVSPQEIEEGS
jgi:hypothetical protein